MIASQPAANPAAMALEVRVVTGAGGGPEKTILNTPRFIREHGYETICVYMHPPEDPDFEIIRRRAAEWNAPLISVPDRGIRDIGVLRTILRICRKHKVKIWHGHDYKSNLLGLLLRPFHRMKLVTTVHGWVNFEGNMQLYTKLDRWCVSRYQHVICVSKDLMDECEGLRIPANRLTLVKNGIDELQFRPSMDRTTAKAKFNLPTNGLVIGAVGRLAEEKGFQFLLPAVAKMVDQGQDVTLVIAGEGTMRQALETQIDELGIRDRVRLIGFQDNTAELFQAFDIFCLSSLREGLPNVLLEALACQVPSVSTDLVGVRQIVRQPDVEGLLVEPSSVDALHVALQNLVTSPALRQSIGLAGRQRIVDDFSFRKRIGHIADIYERVLGGNRR